MGFYYHYGQNWGVKNFVFFGDRGVYGGVVVMG